MVIITHKYTIIHGCVGKKAALLQTLVSCRLERAVFSVGCSFYRFFCLCVVV